jgi:hypothetical protein
MRTGAKAYRQVQNLMEKTASPLQVTLMRVVSIKYMMIYLTNVQVHFLCDSDSFALAANQVLDHELKKLMFVTDAAQASPVYISSGLF